MTYCATNTLRGWRPSAGADVRRFVEDIMSRVAQLPAEDQIGPRPTKQGSVDLTGGKLFLQDTNSQLTLVGIVEKHSADRVVQWEGGRSIKVHAAVRILLKTLFQIHSFWIQRTILSPEQQNSYHVAVVTLTNAWKSLSWKPTVWVHWVCAHSSFYVRTHRSLYSFSSIPTEYRHQTFKMDLRHAFEGWKFQNPLLTARWLTRVVDLNALDQGLHILSLTQDVDNDAIFKRASKRPKLA